MSQFCKYLTIKGLCIAHIDKNQVPICNYKEEGIYRNGGELIICEDFEASEDITRKLEIHMEIEA